MTVRRYISWMLTIFIFCIGIFSFIYDAEAAVRVQNSQASFHMQNPTSVDTNLYLPLCNDGEPLVTKDPAATMNIPTRTPAPEDYIYYSDYVNSGYPPASVQVTVHKDGAFTVKVEVGGSRYFLVDEDRIEIFPGELAMNYDANIEQSIKNDPILQWNPTWVGCSVTYPDDVESREIIYGRDSENFFENGKGTRLIPGKYTIIIRSYHSQEVYLLFGTKSALLHKSLTFEIPDPSATPTPAATMPPILIRPTETPTAVPTSPTATSTIQSITPSPTTIQEKPAAYNNRIIWIPIVIALFLIGGACTVIFIKKKHFPGKKGL